MASAKLSKTFSSAGNMNKWTISLWLKRSKTGVEQIIASCYENNNYQTQIKFETDDQLYFNDENNGNTNGRIVSNATYRDTNGFYHMVFIWDKDNSTSGDKLRMYVNGERITSFSDTGNAPSASSTWNSANTTQQFGAKATSDYFDGIMTHIHFCDGYAYEPTEFGETDSTTGIWKPKISPSVTYGTNGYFLKMDNAANMGLDSGGGSNNFTVSGTIIQNKDTPNNVFATLNPLNLQPSSPPTLINGNTTVSAIADNDNVSTTLGGSFKWYYEAKVLQNPDASNGYGAAIGACHEDTFSYAGWAAGTRSGFENSAVKWYGNTVSNAGRFLQGAGNQIIAGLTQATAGDIVGCACDPANGKVYIHINGVYQNSGDPVNGTGFIGGTAGKTGLWFPWINSEHTYGTVDVNFGNGYFGTTAVTSAQNPDDGNGIFEYDVPAGYRALCTKSLNAQEYS